MAAGNRRLQLKPTRVTERRRGRQVPIGANDRYVIPAGPILISQQHQPSLIIKSRQGARR